MKFKNLILPIATVGTIGSTSGIYFLSKSEKKEMAKVETEQEKILRVKLENKKIVDNLFSECQNGIMKNRLWNNFYNAEQTSQITFDCGSKQVIMNISGNPENDYRKIVDTTDRWWSGKTKKFIVFEISEKN